MIERMGTCGHHIFDVELSEDAKWLTVTEACDLYYDVDLNKAQVEELANDLLLLARKMKEWQWTP